MLWVLVVGWQVEEHLRVQEGGEDGIARPRGCLQEFPEAPPSAARGSAARCCSLSEPVLNLLVNGPTNELSRPSKIDRHHPAAEFRRASR